MSRILCIDYGERHTGAAISDQTRTIVQGLPTIHHRSESALLAAICRLVAEHEVTAVVLGLPLGQSGKPSTRSKQVRRFGARLSRELQLPVTMFDERFSSSRAHEILDETYAGRLAPKKRRAAADRIAAMLILEDYLQAQKTERET